MRSFIRINALVIPFIFSAPTFGLPSKAFCDGQDGDKLAVIFEPKGQSFNAYITQIAGKSLSFSPKTLPCNYVQNDREFSCIDCFSFDNPTYVSCYLFVAKANNVLEYTDIRVVRDYRITTYTCKWSQN